MKIIIVVVNIIVIVINDDQARKPASLNGFTEGECAAWLKKWSEEGACGCSQRLTESPNAADFGLRSTGGDDDAFFDLNFDDSFDE